MSKEYVFVGRAQLKTRDYIYQIENENRELNQEIERLNNIINKLEKDINKRIERYDVDETINGIVTGTLKYVLDKLQELKGSSNNE